MEIAVFGMYLLGVFTGFYGREEYMKVKARRASKRAQKEAEKAE